MASDMKTQLEAIYGKAAATATETEPPPKAEPEQLIWVPDAGAASPAFFTGTVVQAFKRYGTECSGKDCEDPRGVCVTLFEENFPKLLKMLVRADGKLPERKARAKAVVPQLLNESFNASLHKWEAVRLMTLFWIQDTVTKPDGIYPNCGSLVEGDEVYIKRYSDTTGRLSAEVKLVFVTIRSGGMRAPVTSFFEKPQRLSKYCGTPAIYVRVDTKK